MRMGGQCMHSQVSERYDTIMRRYLMSLLYMRQMYSVVTGGNYFSDCDSTPTIAYFTPAGRGLNVPLKSVHYGLSHVIARFLSHI